MPSLFKHFLFFFLFLVYLFYLLSLKLCRWISKRVQIFHLKMMSPCFWNIVQVHGSVWCLILIKPELPFRSVKIGHFGDSFIVLFLFCKNLTLFHVYSLYFEYILVVYKKKVFKKICASKITVRLIIALSAHCKLSETLMAWASHPIHQELSQLDFWPK